VKESIVYNLKKGQSTTRIEYGWWPYSSTSISGWFEIVLFSVLNHSTLSRSTIVRKNYHPFSTVVWVNVRGDLVSFLKFSRNPVGRGLTDCWMHHWHSWLMKQFYYTLLYRIICVKVVFIRCEGFDYSLSNRWLTWSSFF